MPTYVEFGVACPTDASVAWASSPLPGHTGSRGASAVPGQDRQASSGDDADGPDTLARGSGMPGTAEAVVANGSGSSATDAVSGTSERPGARWPQLPQNMSSSVSGEWQYPHGSVAGLPAAVVMASVLRVSRAAR